MLIRLISMAAVLTLSSQALAYEYVCDVSEPETQTKYGEMTFDTATQIPSFVTIDRYLYSVCKGSEIGGTAVMMCGYVIETTPPATMETVLEKARNLTSDSRSVAITLDTAGFLALTYKRNARGFQTVCIPKETSEDQ
jgi:hypothetical protein